MSSPGPSSDAPMSGFDALTKDTKAQGYWVRRIVAYVIDVIIIDLVLTILAFLSLLPVLATSGPGLFFALLGSVVGIVQGVVLFLYFILTEQWFGSSVGKQVLGLKVVAEGGRRPNAGESAMRNISKVYWLLLLLDVIVGLALSKQYTQKYSDFFVKTSVVLA